MYQILLILDENEATT